MMREALTALFPSCWSHQRAVALPPDAALAGRRLQWSAAESDLVSVGIAVRDLAHAVGVGFPFRRIKSPIGYLRDERIEVIDEERVHGVAGVLRPLHNVHEPMLCKLPHGLCVVWEECGHRAQQPFVPRERRRVVGDWNSREQVEIRGMNHSSCSLYSKLRTSPLDIGLEQGYTCSIQLLNAPGKVSLFHPARPIEKARTSLAPFLSRTDHERVALRAPQYKGSRAQEPVLQRGALLMWYAGIDWATDHHDVVVIDEKGHHVGSLRIDHSPQGMSRLHTFLEQIIGSEPKEQMACIIETTHGLLIAHLLEAGWPVYPVNPRTVDRRRSASGAKTDTIDAYLLAKTGRADLADLHRLTPDSEKIVELKLLTRDQDALVHMQTRLVNQLTACLKA